MLYPLRPEDGNQGDAQKGQSQEEGAPPGQRPHPRVPRNARARWLALEKPRHLIRAVARNRPRRQGTGQVLSPSVLRCRVIVGRRNASEQKSHKVGRRDRPSAPHHSQNDDQFASNQGPPPGEPSQHAIQRPDDGREHDHRGHRQMAEHHSGGVHDVTGVCGQPVHQHRCTHTQHKGTKPNGAVLF